MADTPKYFFLNLQCAQIIGNSNKIGHQKWLEVDSWNFHMSSQPRRWWAEGRRKGPWRPAPSTSNRSTPAR